MNTVISPESTFLVIVGCFVAAYIPLVVALWLMRKLVAYSNQNGFPILERFYSSGIHLHMDPSFHWQLLKGAATVGIQDPRMLALIKRLRLLMLVSVTLGAVFLAVFGNTIFRGAT